MTDISVIVPIFKVEKYLRKCLNGLLAQTHKNFEIILVNDGSPDGCGNICEEYKKIDSRIKVIHQENSGTGMARNRGLEIATGKYIYFCDPDDYMENTLLSENFLLAEQYEANMVIFGYYDVTFTKSGNKSSPKSYNQMFLKSQSTFQSEFINLYKENLMFTLWNKLYKKEFLDENNCFFADQKVGQDTVFNYKVYENLDKVYVNDRKYYHYVIDRTGSAVNVYRRDRFEIRYKETERFEELVNKWGNNEKYKPLILNDWVTTLSVGLNNLFYNDCPMDSKMKISRIKEFISTPKIKYVLNEMKLKEVTSLFMKIELYLLKNNRLLLALNMLKFKKTLKTIIK
ncbi:glycosyltransferase family 2 protein [Priestia aryabhattai]|uniref:glycosyltransferase family 2 protein n=1 Tax=Priestia aryabhattai TaxID=412384 RepID=UPI0025A39536|nr:glycosyltransferase family 2 protein [Priestia aryabhattai]WJN45977.1 glycosyltransferase family 2 protein [Priestia aryabhattai]